MKSALSRALFVLLLALAGAAFSAGEVAVPPLKSRVTDLTGTLTASQIQALESRLREFEQRKGSQIAVLVVPSTKPETIEQYSIRVAEAWKIGRAKIDDGLIVVVAKDERQVRVEVGRGLEGVVPDVIASRVIREIIVPRFQAGDFHGGLVDATQVLMKLIEGEPLPPRKGTGGGDSRGRDDQGIFVVLLILALVGGGILSRLLGRGGGAIGTGAIVGIAAWVLTGTLILAAIAGIAGLLFTLVSGAGGSVRHRGGWGGGGFGGGGLGGGGFGGGGGGFGGGGASGRW